MASSFYRRCCEHGKRGTETVRTDNVLSIEGRVISWQISGARRLPAPPILDRAARAPSAIPPPQLLGPVAAPSPASESSPASVPTPAPAVAPAIAPTPLPLDAFPLERCARLDATLALDPGAEPSILEQH